MKGYEQRMKHKYCVQYDSVGKSALPHVRIGLRLPYYHEKPSDVS